MRWIGESVSTVVSSAAVGGDIVRARLAALRGTPLPIAAASVLVDITLGVFTQFGFTLVGLALIVNVTGGESFVGPTLIGALLGIVAIIGFCIVQRLGMFRFIGVIISRIANSPDWHSLIHGGETLDRTIPGRYSRRRGVIGCCVWTTGSLVLGSGEISITLMQLACRRRQLTPSFFKAWS